MEQIWTMMLNDVGALNRLETHPSAADVLSAAGVGAEVVARATRFCEGLPEDVLMELVIGDPTETPVTDQEGYAALKAVCDAFWNRIDS